MSIGFNCDDCGKCDDCLGIVWPEPPSITKKQARMMRIIAKRFGKAFAERLDRDIEKVSRLGGARK